MADLVAILSADTSQLQKALDDAKSTLLKYKTEASKTSQVTQQLVNSFNNSVNSLNKLINSGKNVTQLMKGLQTQITNLSAQYNALSEEAKNDEFGKAMAKSINEATERFRELQRTTESVRNSLVQVQSASNNISTSKSFDFKGLKGGIKDVSSAMNTLGILGGSTLNLISSMGTKIANPYVLAGVAVAGATYAFVDFNVELDKQVQKTQKFLDISKEGAISVRNAIKSIVDVYAVDFDSALSMVDKLSRQFGISAKEATDLIAVGMAGGANEAGRMADMIDLFSGVLSDAGVTAELFVGILSQTQSGIFSEQGLDVIVRGLQKLAEMSSVTASSLEAIGINATEMGKKMNSGAMNGWLAIQQVSKELSKLSPDTKAYAEVVRNVFGKVGVNAGSELISMLSEMDASIEGVKNRMSETERATYDLQQSEKDLQGALSSLFGVSESGFGTMFTQLKNNVYTACTDVINRFINLYNKSLLVRAGIADIGFIFKALWSVCKQACILIGKELADLTLLLESALDFNTDGMLSAWEAMKKDATGTIDNMINELLQAWKDGVAQTENGHIKIIEVKEEKVTTKRTKGYKGEDDDEKKSKGNKSTSKTAKIEAVKGSLTDLENQLSELQKKYKDGLIKLTPSQYKSKVEDLQKQIKDKKLELQIDFDKALEGLDKSVEKELENAFNGLNKKEKVTYKTEGIKQKEDNSLEGRISTMKETVDSNDDIINKNIASIGELQTEQQKLNDLIEEMNSLLGEDKANWGEEQVERYNELTEAVSEYNKEIEKLNEQNTNLIKTNTSLVENINDSLDSLDNTKDKILKVTNTKEQLGLLGSAFNTMGNAVGGTEGSIISLVGSTLLGVALMIPAIMSLFTAQEAEAIGGATASGASLPYPANIVAIASGVAAVLSAFASATFADGGIISGSTSIGDYNIARVNSGEMILNGTQQKRLFSMLNGSSTANTNNKLSADVVITGQQMHLLLKNYGKTLPNGLKL